MGTKALTAFQNLSHKLLHAESDLMPTYEGDLESQLNMLINQIMLNEYGFNYMLAIEFNDDMFKEFLELRTSAQALVHGAKNALISFN